MAEVIARYSDGIAAGFHGIPFQSATEPEKTNFSNIERKKDTFKFRNAQAFYRFFLHTYASKATALFHHHHFTRSREQITAQAILDNHPVHVHARPNLSAIHIISAPHKMIVSGFRNSPRHLLHKTSLNIVH